MCRQSSRPAAASARNQAHSCLSAAFASILRTARLIVLWLGGTCFPSRLLCRMPQRRSASCGIAAANCAAAYTESAPHNRATTITARIAARSCRTPFGLRWSVTFPRYSSSEPLPALMFSVPKSGCLRPVSGAVSNAAASALMPPGVSSLIQ